MTSIIAITVSGFVACIILREFAVEIDTCMNRWRIDKSNTKQKCYTNKTKNPLER